MKQINTMAHAGTQYRVVLDYFYEAEEATLQQAKADLFDQLGQKKAAAPICSLIHDGRLVQEGEIIRLSRAMKVLFDTLHHKKADVVSQPYRNVFGPSISAKNIPSSKGPRPDSDSRIYQSKHV